MQASSQDIPLSTVASTVKQKCPTVLFISQTFLLIAELNLSFSYCWLMMTQSHWEEFIAQCPGSQNWC